MRNNTKSQISVGFSWDKDTSQWKEIKYMLLSEEGVEIGTPSMMEALRNMQKPVSNDIAKLYLRQQLGL